MTTRRKREPTVPIADLAQKILAVNRMTTGELKEELCRLTGEESRTFNRAYLVRRVAFLIQAQAARAGEPASKSEPSVAAAGPGSLRVRDARLPAPGSEIVKRYKGCEVRVRVLDRGFEFFGMTFDSLTAVAKAITGQKFINGFLFFGLVKRKRTK